MTRIKFRLEELGEKPIRKARLIARKEAKEVIPDPGLLQDAEIVASEILNNTDHGSEGSILIQCRDDNRLSMIVVTAINQGNESLDCVAGDDHEDDIIKCHGRGLEIARALCDNLRTGTLNGFYYTRVVFTTKP